MVESLCTVEQTANGSLWSVMVSLTKLCGILWTIHTFARNVTHLTTLQSAATFNSGEYAKFVVERWVQHIFRDITTEDLFDQITSQVFLQKMLKEAGEMVKSMMKHISMKFSMKPVYQAIG